MTSLLFIMAPYYKMLLIIIVIVFLISMIFNNNVFSFKGDGLCVWLAVGPMMFRDDVALF